MNVSSSTSNLSAADFQAGKNRFEQSFNKLSSALDSGDLSGAQAALTSLKPKNAPEPPKGSENNPVAKAFSSLSSALQKGDLSSAKEAFSALKTEMQSARASGRPPGPPPGEASNSSEETSGTTATIGNNLNTVA